MNSGVFLGENHPGGFIQKGLGCDQFILGGVEVEKWSRRFSRRSQRNSDADKLTLGTRELEVGVRGHSFPFEFKMQSRVHQVSYVLIMGAKIAFLLLVLLAGRLDASGYPRE